MGTDFMRAMLLATASAVTVAVGAPTAAYAQEATYQVDIPAQSMGDALRMLGKVTKQNIVFNGSVVRGKRSAAVRGRMTASEALAQMLAGSGLTMARGSGGGLTVVMGGNAGTIDAETGPGPVLEQDIVVTGTNIRGVSSPSPRTEVGREEIERRGFSSVDQIIRSLPQALNGGAQRGGQIGDSSDDSVNNYGRGSSVNLRGLGAGATLVLLDGHRFPGSSPGQFADIGMVPVAAIEKVEIIADGASAIYGSDAVAGVVNFILKRDYEGVDVHTNWGVATRGGYQESSADVSFGDIFSGGSIVGGLQFLKRGNLEAADRSFSRSAPGPTDLFGKEQTISGFMNGRFDLSSALSLSAQGFLAKRNVTSVFTNPNSRRTSISKPETLQLGANLGLEWVLGGGWVADINGNYGENEIVSGPSPTQRTRQRFRGTTRDAGITVSGPLLALPGGDVRVALGANILGEGYSQRSSSVATDNSDDARHRVAVFGEAVIPIFGRNNAVPFARRLDLSLAVRHEKYSDFGSTTNPKFGLTWEPAEGLTIRGTYGRSFRAPTFLEIATQDPIYLLFRLPDPQSSAGTSITLLRLAAANPDLQPERAKSWTAGFDFTPLSLPGLKLSATYFDIDYNGRIERPTAVPLDFLRLPELTPFVDRTPDLAFVQSVMTLPWNGSTGYLSTIGAVAPSAVAVFADNRYANISRSKVSGIDLQISYETDASFGRFFSSFTGTYLIKGERELVAASGSVPFVDTLGNPVDLRFRGEVGGSAGPVLGAVTANYVDSYRTASQPVSKIRSFLTFDVNLVLSLGELFGEPALNNTRLGLHASNIFDRSPPPVAFTSAFLTPIGYDPVNASPLGRVISLDLRKSF